MERLCLSCNQIFSQSLFFCEPCKIRFNVLARNTPSWGPNIHCLYPYRDEMKRLVHAAKIENRTAALEAIADLCFQHPVFKKIVSTSDACMAAPSSLWGRLRGRNDIAGFLSTKINQLKPPTAKLRLLNAPTLSYMNIRKRSLYEGRHSMLPQLRGLINSHNKNNKNPVCLLIDDILTSGETLLRLLKTPVLNQYRWTVLAFASNSFVCHDSFPSVGRVDGLNLSGEENP